MWVGEGGRPEEARLQGHAKSPVPLKTLLKQPSPPVTFRSSSTLVLIPSCLLLTHSQPLLPHLQRFPPSILHHSRLSPHPPSCRLPGRPATPAAGGPRPRSPLRSQRRPKRSAPRPLHPHGRPCKDEAAPSAPHPRPITGPAAAASSRDGRSRPRRRRPKPGWEGARSERVPGDGRGKLQERQAGRRAGRAGRAGRRAAPAPAARTPLAAQPRTAPAPANNRLRPQRSDSYRRRHVPAEPRGRLGNRVPCGPHAPAACREL